MSHYTSLHSITTEISTKVLPTPKNTREKHQQQNVAQKQKRVH